jgi:hypothetical protein
LSLIGLATIICTYALISELRANVHGKMIIALAVSMFASMGRLIIHHGSSYHFMFTFLGYLGFWSSLMWNVVMFFDSFWTFLFFKSPDVGSKRFKIYGAFVTLVLSLLFWFLVKSEFDEVFLLMFYSFLNFIDESMIAASAVSAIAAGLFAFRLSKALSRSESSRFKEEIDR